MGKDNIHNLDKGTSIEDILKYANDYSGGNLAQEDSIQDDFVDHRSVGSDASISFSRMLEDPEVNVSLLGHNLDGDTVGKVYKDGKSIGSFNVRNGSIYSVLPYTEPRQEESFDYADDVVVPRVENASTAVPGSLFSSNIYGSLRTESQSLNAPSGYIPGTADRRYMNRTSYVDNSGILGGFSAIVRSETSIGAGVQISREFVDTFDQPNARINFNDYLTDEEKLYADKFKGVETMGELYARRNSLSLERLDRSIVEGMSTGKSLGLGLLAQALDPVNWFSYGLGWAAKGASYSSKAFHAGKIATAQTVSQEALLQAAQYERSLEESASNVAFSFCLFVGSVGYIGGME